MSDFKVGDKVKVVCTGMHPHALVGQTGVVTDTDAGDIWPYGVQFADGAHEIFNHKEIELVVEAAPEPKIGDRVRLEGSKHGLYKDGAEGVLIEPDGNFAIWPYAIEFDHGGSEVFSRDEFVVIAPEEHLAEDEPDYGTSGETNLTYQASDVPNHRVEALFAAIQSYAGTAPMAATAPDIVRRAHKFLTFLEGTDD